MTADQLAQEVGSLWDALALAGQGAFSNAHPANGQGTKRDAQQALRSFLDVAAAANTHLAKLTKDFAIRRNPMDTKALLAIESERQDAEREVQHVIRQLVHQVTRAIRSGNPSGAAVLLHDAHGGIGMLVGRRAGILTLHIRDKSERHWKNPRRLVETIVRHFAVQAQVIVTLSELRAKGRLTAFVGERELTLEAIEEQRHTLFHPNSKEMPRADLYA